MQRRASIAPTPFARPKQKCSISVTRRRHSVADSLLVREQAGVTRLHRSSSNWVRIQL
jgi:hypothetical protein